MSANETTRKRLSMIGTLIVLPLLLPLGTLTAADLKLASVFADHGVVQRDRPVPIWGTADPSEEVTVSFAEQSKTGVADSSGRWKVLLDPMSASAQSRELVVQSKSRHVKLTVVDVLVGDVWLCAGQSNIGVDVANSLNPEQEISDATFPLIRHFAVATNPVLEPASDIKGQWKVCSPLTVSKFSGVAYFFGRELHRELNVPIGLVVSTVGATRAELWTRLEALERLPITGERVKTEVARMQSRDEDNRRFLVERAAWEQQHGVRPPPLVEPALGWAAPDLDTSDWKQITVPVQWRWLGIKSGGVFWLRKEFTLPEALAGKPLWLSLNLISEQYDTVFFNGVEVGRGSDAPPDFYCGKRGYSVPAALVKPGRVVIAVRIVSATEQASIQVEGRNVFPYAGLANVDNNWLMKTESTFPPLPREVLSSRPKPNQTAIRDVPSALYNGMIAPLMPMAIQGAVWYQGEGNVFHPGEYRDLLETLITDWRTQWGQGDFPFLVVQLANYWRVPIEPGESAVARVREAQLQVVDKVSACGLAVAIDIGEKSIHPRNKQDVGKRLALVAFQKVYAKEMAASGPRYESMSIEGPAIRVKFSHAQGLFSKDGPPKWFSIAGADEKFVWADAKIEEDTVVVSSPSVKEPVAVRYAWADNPEGCNVYNHGVLPAAPFRTDAWEWK
jgi:sialate O-acetylesterase